MQLLNKKLNEFKKSAQRLETLPYYYVEGEWDLYLKYINGNLDYRFKPSPWFERVEKGTKNNITYERVRVIPQEVNSYIDFEFEIGYVPHSLAGEKITIISQEKYEKLLSENKFRNVDFWIFDDKEVLILDYDSDFHFKGSRLVTEADEVAKYVAIFNLMKENSIDYREILKLLRNKKITYK